jgi:hypothetical protein
MATALRLVTTPAEPVRIVRCAAAPAEDSTPCVGGLAVVRIVDQHGMEATGCVHHAATLYASLVGARVYPSPGHAGAATEVYIRAQTQPAITWPAAA